MLRNRSSYGVSALLVLVSGVGCGGEESAEDIEIGATSAIVDNALTANALTANALTANALTANALTANALRDPLAREFLKYVVSCALDEGDSISIRVDGKNYKFEGSLGLAPDWGHDEHGTCDGSCQRWVSACVLSRVDFAGVKRPISIRGDNRALRPEAGEMRNYSVAEGAYFGNLFIAGQPRYLCLAPGQDQDERVCGPSLANCPMKVVGACDDACDHVGAYKSFAECSSSGRADHYRVYEETITVFLPR